VIWDCHEQNQVPNTPDQDHVQFVHPEFAGQKEPWKWPEVTPEMAGELPVM
jgi:phenylpropionate dioxygenase-like ring-hydroxylating dioxygenase large terminal subunit